MLERFAQRLTEKYPQLQIAGSCASRFRTLSESERDQLADQINGQRGGNLLRRTRLPSTGGICL